MNNKKAVQILNLKEPFQKKDIKKSYYSLAIKYHPDKSITETDNKKFLEIKDAYEFLINDLNLENVDDSIDDYMELLKKCIKLISPNTNWSNLFMDTTFKSIINDCQNISLKFFKELNKDRAIEMFCFLSQHKNVFNIRNEVLEQMKIILKEKRKNDNLVILNPTIDNLFDETIYILDIYNKKYYIPLWANELCYDISGHDLIVKCIPEVEPEIRIDDYNNIFLSHQIEIMDTLLHDINFTLGSQIFTIPCSELKIIKKQTYCLYNKGIPVFDEISMYNTSKKSNIYVDIYLC